MPVALMLLVLTGRIYAAQSLANFTGSITTPPVVDATNFNNSGTWNIITTPYPYATADTLNYTNSGSMTGSFGWNFSLNPAGNSGVSALSSLFLNQNNGIITAVDGVTGSQLLIGATNVVNFGQLNAGAAGKIQITGNNVNLSRSVVQIQPLISTGGTYTKPLSFAGDVGIYDQAWGLGTNFFNPSINFYISSGFSNVVVITNITLATTNYYTNLVGSYTTRAPEIVNNVSAPCGVSIGTFNTTYMPYSTDNYLYAPTNLVSTNSPSGTNVITGYSSWTNIFQIGNVTLANSNTVRVPTNLIIQAVFVRVADTNINAQVAFYPSTVSTNPALTASVLLSFGYTNLATLQSSLSTLCLVDTMISQNNKGLATNSTPNLIAGCSGKTFRPANYTLSRTPQNQFTAGSPGLGVPTNNVLWQADFLTNILAVLNPSIPNFAGVTNRYGANTPSANYTAYSAFVDNLASEPPAAASPSLTNFPGEVRLYATNLNLYLARIRSEGELLIQTGNLTPASTNSVVDCQNLSYNIGSTNGFLHFQNLAKTNVTRLNGTISVCSITWTNVINQTFPDGTTNAIQTTLYAMVLDATSLSSKSPVLVYDLLLHATNILISDQMVVQQNLLLDGKAFTLDSPGVMTLGTYLPNWSYTNMPSVNFFTNNGIITVANNASFGNDGPVTLSTFVNRGTISSLGQGIGAAYMELDGTNNAGTNGQFQAVCANGILSNALVYGGSGVQLSAGSLTISNTTIASGDALSFIVTNGLTDGGAGSSNNFLCANGFNLYVKPTYGDLHGTTLTSYISGGSQVNHIWAGQDFGSSIAGYLNNVAVGTLVLSAGNLGLQPLFNFAGAGSQNGMYVDTLDVSSLGTDVLNDLQVQPNLTIYYNNAIDPALTNANASLNGQLGGHLVWLGSNQSTNIIFGTQPPLLGTNGFKLTVSGVLFPSGLWLSNTLIQASTNLLNTNWVNIYTGTPPFTLTNFDYTNFPQRYYRAKQGW